MYFFAGVILSGGALLLRAGVEGPLFWQDHSPVLISPAACLKLSTVPKSRH